MFRRARLKLITSSWARLQRLAQYPRRSGLRQVPEVLRLLDLHASLLLASQRERVVQRQPVLQLRRVRVRPPDHRRQRVWLWPLLLGLDLPLDRMLRRLLESQRQRESDPLLDRELSQVLGSRRQPVLDQPLDRAPQRLLGRQRQPELDRLRGLHKDLPRGHRLPRVPAFRREHRLPRVRFRRHLRV